MLPVSLQNLIRSQRAHNQPKAIAPMAYDPGAVRQFTPSPAPYVPFMPAPQVGPQQIATGFGGAPGSLAGFGGQPNIGPGLPPLPTGDYVSDALTPKPMTDPKAPTTGIAGALKGFNPQMAQYGMQLLQRARSQPLQMSMMQQLRGGR